MEFQMTDLATDCYVECQWGTTAATEDAKPRYFRPTGAGLCTGVLAACATEEAKAALTVPFEAATASWDDAYHLNAYLSGRVQHAPLRVNHFCNFKYWGGSKLDLASPNRMIAARPFLVHYNFLEPGEVRPAIESDGRWLLGDDVMKSEMMDGDVASDDDDELVVV